MVDDEEERLREFYSSDWALWRLLVHSYSRVKKFCPVFAFQPCYKRSAILNVWWREESQCCCLAFTFLLTPSGLSAQLHTTLHTASPPQQQGNDKSHSSIPGNFRESNCHQHTLRFWSLFRGNDNSKQEKWLVWKHTARQHRGSDSPALSVWAWIQHWKAEMVSAKHPEEKLPLTLGFSYEKRWGIVFWLQKALENKLIFYTTICHHLQPQKVLMYSLTKRKVKQPSCSFNFLLNKVISYRNKFHTLPNRNTRSLIQVDLTFSLGPSQPLVKEVRK